MTKIVIDSSAWIEYFSGTEKGKQVRDHLNNAEGEIFTTGLIVAEVTSKFLRENQNISDLLQALKSIAKIVQFDFQMGTLSAEIFVKQRKTQTKFGLADAHVAAAAEIIQGKTITCDNDFNGLRAAIIIK